MEQKSKDRKERLQELKQQSVRFRAYKPESVELQAFIEPQPLAGPTAKRSIDTVERRADNLQDKAIQEENDRSKELDLFNLAPKKPNWDLKRDLENKMAKLDSLTEIAMNDIIRQRLNVTQDITSVD